jgi:hypothetical protein
MAKKAVAAENNAPGRRLTLFIIELVKFLPVALTLATEVARARRLPRRLPAVPLLRVRHPLRAAAALLALEVRGFRLARRFGAARFLLARRFGAARLPAFRRRVRHAFFAAAERDALVPLRDRDFEDDLRDPLRALRFLVAAAFFADALRLLAFRRRVAAAFFAAALRLAVVGRRVADFREPLRELRFLVAAAFFADALRLLALRFLVAAAFFAAAVLDAFVLRLVVVFAMFFRLGFLELGGLTRIRFA